MMHIKYFLITVLCSFLLYACTSSNGIAPHQSPGVILAHAEKELQRGDFKEAILQLSAFNANYPLSPYCQQVQLDLVYAYYKNNNFPLALETIDHFLRLYPDHSNLDYIMYMRGLIYMEKDNNPIQTFFGIDRSDRDPIHRLSAFNSFSKMLQNYPNSRYSIDARKRLIFLKECQAKYELSVAEFYEKHRAYIAVVNRVDKMLIDYPDAKATQKALQLMEDAYRQLHLNAQADRIAKIIVKNPV
ncbi:outer membrane protein assembly factor BamD [Candidatus Erwinia haradaeae]|uniref:Outer membrane protein assembly factor BamD n=1 Tax=Candidatus Erwinia haradaeae TaxID=1922217 RepID=A0A451DHW0_9GAMM|nr:outer membrane protein assembly factor BamD [Candidatus Erwinia haradaeae]VFP86200.1 Outer membrane protein assembly factor BamD [Candidatus Erwinia haradaeae]